MRIPRILALQFAKHSYRYFIIVTPEAALSLGPVTELESSTVEPSRIRKIAMGRPLNLDHLHNFGIGEVMKRALSRRAFLQRTAAVGAATLIREVVLATVVLATHGSRASKDVKDLDADEAFNFNNH